MSSHEFQHRPIAACSTGPGPGAVSMIRMSGHGTHRLLQSSLSLNTASVQMRHSYYTKFLQSNQVLDDVVVVFFAHKASYTGEESAEMTIHGGGFLIRTVLDHLQAIGFFLAEPGEFTQRAFLNGKLDLNAAEGINLLVNAQSHQEWVAGRQLTSGRLSKEILNLRTGLLSLLAQVEALIDFPDESDITTTDFSHLLLELAQLRDSIDTLADSYQRGRVMGEGLKVVLCGAPNVGKSTLLNTLLREHRAIVSEVAGTTRDYISEKTTIQGRLFRFIDTAGVRTTTSSIEAQGIAATAQQARSADLVLLLVPSDWDTCALKESEAIAGKWGARQVLRVRTKGDLGTPEWHTPDWVVVERTNATALETELVRLVDTAVTYSQDHVIVTSERQRTALAQASQAIKRSLSLGEEHELLAYELQEASNLLEAILGKIDVEEVLGEVFGRFCVGK